MPLPHPHSHPCPGPSTVQGTKGWLSPRRLPRAAALPPGSAPWQRAALRCPPGWERAGAARRPLTRRRPSRQGHASRSVTAEGVARAGHRGPSLSLCPPLRGRSGGTVNQELGEPAAGGTATPLPGGTPRAWKRTGTSRRPLEGPGAGRADARRVQACGEQRPSRDTGRGEKAEKGGAGGLKCERPSGKRRAAWTSHGRDGLPCAAPCGPRLGPARFSSRERRRDSTGPNRALHGVSRLGDVKRSVTFHDA